MASEDRRRYNRCLWGRFRWVAYLLLFEKVIHIYNRTLTSSEHFAALVYPLRTPTVEAVPQVCAAWQAVHAEDVLGTDGTLPVTVLRQVALVLLPSALRGPRRHLRGGKGQGRLDQIT